MLLLQEKGWKGANSIPLILDRVRKEKNQRSLTVTDIAVESKRNIQSNKNRKSVSAFLLLTTIFNTQSTFNKIDNQKYHKLLFVQYSILFHLKKKSSWGKKACCRISA